MGFWDSLGGALKDAGKGLMDTGREMQSNKIKYESYPDDRLAHLCKGGGFAEKTAAYAVLKERYGEEGAKDLIRRA